MDHRLLTERIHYYAPAINIVLALTVGGNPNIEELKTAIRKGVDKHDIFRSRVVFARPIRCWKARSRPTRSACWPPRMKCRP